MKQNETEIRNESDGDFDEKTEYDTEFGFMEGLATISELTIFEPLH